MKGLSLRLAIPVLLCTASPLLLAQTANRTLHRMERAEITHESGRATLNADDSRPLAQAVTALRQEYGWLLDYEDPLYSGTELAPVKDEDWASPFPHRKGLLLPAGGTFTTSFPERSDSAMDSDDDRRSVLKQMLIDHAKSSNPGAFSIIETAPSRFDIVGRHRTQAPVLDTRVTITIDGELAYGAIRKVLKMVQDQTGHGLGMGMVPTNELMHCTVTDSYADESARSVLIKMLDSCHLNMTWALLYNPNVDMFFLNLDDAVKAYIDDNGRRILRAIPKKTPNR